ncbi:MAG: hypothetical protein L0H59_01085 [Tomitella sp.]|nr:hypothetical protein [Tomitella sp.]
MITVAVDEQALERSMSAIINDPAYRCLQGHGDGSLLLCLRQALNRLSDDGVFTAEGGGPDAVSVRLVASYLDLGPDLENMAEAVSVSAEFTRRYRDMAGLQVSSVVGVLQAVTPAGLTDITSASPREHLVRMATRMAERTTVACAAVSAVLNSMVPTDLPSLTTPAVAGPG